MKVKYYIIFVMVMCAITKGWAQTNDAQTVRGYASFYSNCLHGSATANGGRYDKNRFTCAHLKYRMGTMLKIRNPKNGKECVVEVTDRGPYSKKFVIDLSYVAAEYLDFIKAGFTMVEITPFFATEASYRMPEPKLPEVPKMDLKVEAMNVYPVAPWHPEELRAEIIARGTLLPLSTQRWISKAGNERLFGPRKPVATKPVILNS